eukprot:CAMPEP_0170613246 /NCGR_PEP_ID=MMETSP0224-20130122/24168_1 /TAXON_ID=285029 /ORGANISM="Togula jolla, Strain CCCM 725" /LENGTH=193 /DNA_ID=CAMNT_0010938831 /DNA_START=15 /DNA_END=596 /DNA_ORIENTATION=-
MKQLKQLEKDVKDLHVKNIDSHMNKNSKGLGAEAAAEDFMPVIADNIKQLVMKAQQMEMATHQIESNLTHAAASLSDFEAKHSIRKTQIVALDEVVAALRLEQRASPAEDAANKLPLDSWHAKEEEFAPTLSSRRSGFLDFLTERDLQAILAVSVGHYDLVILPVGEEEEEEEEDYDDDPYFDEEDFREGRRL